MSRDAVAKWSTSCTSSELINKLSPVVGSEALKLCKSRPEDTLYLKTCLSKVETNTRFGSAGIVVRDTGLEQSVMVLMGKKAIDCPFPKASFRTIIVLSDDIDRRVVLSGNLMSLTAAA